MMNNRVAVVIPVYKENLDIISQVSLRYLDKYLDDDKQIEIVCPDGMNCDEYKSLFTDRQLNINYFDGEYFKNTITYSHLLESKNFYATFRLKGYEYILIYQTDCLFLKDNLMEWVDKGYDYIGAPIISNHYVWKVAPTVGNGGFSLRKIETFEYICSDDFKEKYADFLSKVPTDIEDLYFCQYIYQVYDIKKPRYIKAGKFAVDMNPDKVMKELNHYEMPMGIHTWDKNIHYWKHIIDDLKNTDIIIYCDNKWENETKTGVGLYYKMIKAQYKDELKDKPQESPLTISRTC